ncbi:MAG: peptide MFS transporter [Bacteroidia bacterium]|nr:peptide MFS transporter [Bacteroidia bacterium]MDW8345754.1 peptide MFS transporter [Bacteroidia bacterium]
MRTSAKHPKGLYLLFFTEMWERFSYYGMRAIFTLYMAKALLFDKALSSSIYGSYTGLVYLTPLIGGYVADRYWGNRRSILFGGVLMAIGQFLMFASGNLYSVNLATASFLMYLGLGFLIFGNGFFKPNISTMVGQLYPANDKRVDSAFTIFYMGINLGAFFAPLVCGGLGDTGNPADFKWGFLAAGTGMIISILSFYLFKDKYIITPEGKPIGAKPEKSSHSNTSTAVKINVKQILIWIMIEVIAWIFCKGVLGFDVIGAFIYSLGVVAPAYVISDKSLNKIEKHRIWVIYISAFFVIFFWAAFEQAGASLTFFAEEQTNRQIGNTIIPASFFQSINAVAIVIFAPLFAIIWTELAKRNLEPHSPLKQSIGLFLLALGYLIIAFGVKGISPETKVSMLWLITLYLLHTFGELCLSPIGLSMVVKLAPIRFASLLMGIWFLSTAMANKFAGDLSALYPDEIKQEGSIKMTAFSLKQDTLESKITKVDSNYVKSLPQESKVWKLTRASDGYKAPEIGIFEQFLINLGIYQAPQKPKDSLQAIVQLPNVNNYKLSEYHRKLIGLREGENYRVYFSEDGLIAYLVRAKKDNTVEIQYWNLSPKKPRFVGFEITNLYTFFMIFVFMAGAASVILFVISKNLYNMMHEEVKDKE